MAHLRGNYIDGKAVSARVTVTTPVFNPSRGEVIAQVPACGEDDVERAAQAARAALPGWAETPPNERTRILFRYRQLLEESLESLARQVIREHGKTFEEACGEVRRGINVGVPAPMALFPFSGWNQSFFGDLHVQGQEGLQFYTRAKVVLARWSAGGKPGTWS
jgi:acyl-CoA reductase-like NAD-dependent aldehyde dehydrogenase